MAAVRPLTMPLLRNPRLVAQICLNRCLSSKAPSGPAGAAQATPTVPAAPGLSEKVLVVPKEPVGPGAAKDKPYKNPEYFCYHNASYFEAEVELAKFRLPQPSSKAPLK